MPDLIILRGLPGSGKTTFANKAEFDGAVVCSNDHYFEETGIEYSASLLGEAVEMCKRKAFAAMANGAPVVVIDNTHSRLWEFAIFGDFADHFGYSTEVVTVGGRTASHVRMYHARNKHGVPIDVIQDMADRWEEKT